MSRPAPLAADVMDRLAYWHDLRAELPAEAVDAARTYLLGYLAAEVDAHTWADAVDQAVALARAEVETDDDQGGPGPLTALGAAVMTGLGAVGLVELLGRVLATATTGGPA